MISGSISIPSIYKDSFVLYAPKININLVYIPLLGRGFLWKRQDYGHSSNASLVQSGNFTHHYITSQVYDSLLHRSARSFQN